MFQNTTQTHPYRHLWWASALTATLEAGVGLLHGGALAGLAGILPLATSVTIVVMTSDAVHIDPRPDHAVRTERERETAAADGGLDYGGHSLTEPARGSVDPMRLRELRELPPRCPGCEARIHQADVSADYCTCSAADCPVDRFETAGASA